ncbi:unnamed protein product, partial [marine sediment metagenome]
QLLTNAQRIEPRNFDLQVVLGHVYYKRKQYNECLHAYNTALAVTSDKIKACSIHFNKGQIYIETQEFRKAVVEFESFIENAPDGHPEIKPVKDMLFQLHSMLPPIGTAEQFRIKPLKQPYIPKKKPVIPKKKPDIPIKSERIENKFKTVDKPEIPLDRAYSAKNLTLYNEINFCGKCGSKISNGIKNCVKCGTPIDAYIV